MPTANSCVLDTGTPPIPEAGRWLAAYDGRHGPALSLSQAAPGTPPPLAMRNRLADAAREPASALYGRILGDVPLTDVYAAHVSTIYGAAIAPAQVAITTGCNQAFVVAIMAMAKAGDDVLLPEPWYFNHEMTLKMFGVGVIALPCRAENAFVPTVAEARARMTSKTRAIVLVTPNNPTGAIYPPSVIRAFAELAREKSCWLIVDETYRDFLQASDARPHDLFGTPDLAAHVVQLYSFSKSYAIPGHRIGAMIAPAGLMPEIAKILDCLQISAPRVGQMALTWAVPALATWREANRATIVLRARAFERAMSDSKGWRIRSIGAYFAYVAHPFTGRPGVEVARFLAEQCGVLALPGTFFGGADQAQFLRFAFANVDAATIASVGHRLAQLGP